MPYCSRCGVEVNDQITKCPLCHSPIQRFYEEPQPGREFPSDQLNPATPRLSPKEKIRIAFSMTSFGILIPLMITLSVDIFLTGKISWSIYPIIGLVGSWLLTIVPITKPSKSNWIIWSETVVLWGIFAALALFTDLSFRVFQLSFPIILAGAFISQTIVFLSRRTAKKGGNIAGFILLGIGTFCGVTDITISGSLMGEQGIGWSLIVIAALLPVSCMLLYLHYRKKRSKLAKFFHI